MSQNMRVLLLFACFLTCKILQVFFDIDWTVLVKKKWACGQYHRPRLEKYLWRVWTAILSRRWACVEPSGFVSRDQANSTEWAKPSREWGQTDQTVFFFRYDLLHWSCKGKTTHAPYPLLFMTLSSEIWRTAPKQESLWRIEAVLNRIEACVVSLCEASFTLLQLLRLLPEPSEDFSRFWTHGGDKGSGDSGDYCLIVFKFWCHESLKSQSIQMKATAKRWECQREKKSNDGSNTR